MGQIAVRVWSVDFGETADFPGQASLPCQAQGPDALERATEEMRGTADGRKVN